MLTFCKILSLISMTNIRFKTVVSVEISLQARNMILVMKDCVTLSV